MRRLDYLSALLCLGALAPGQTAHGAGAKAFPERPVRIIVPYPPGGANDILARLIAPKLGEAWGQQLVIDNRPGSAGSIGATIAARTTPDGYTLLMGGAGTMTISESLYKSLQFRTLRDFTPLTMIASLPMLLILHPSVPARSVRELIDVARAKPGTLNFMSPGSGTPGHLAGELFKRMTGVDMVHVPYKGGSPAMTDLLAGQVQVSFYNLAPALPHVKAGKLRGIAVTGLKRSPSVPEYPTVAESGVPGFEVIGWWGLFTPRATPEPVTVKLTGDIVRVVKSSEIAQQLVTLAYEPTVLAAGAFRDKIQTEIAKWARVIEASGAHAD